MTSRAFLPDTSLARTQFTAGACAKITSRIKLSVGFGTISYLAFFWILVGSSLFTGALAQPEDQIPGSSNGEWISDKDPVETAVANHHAATGTIQPLDYQKQLGEPHNNVHLGPSLRRNGSQSFQLEQLLAVGRSSELFTQDSLHNLGFPSPDQQFVSFRLSGTPQIAACRGKCLDPHPGPFRYWNGQQNGCLVQVWRRWPEGCQHYQWYNSCNGYWDNHPNGAPRVFWNCCVH